MFKKIYLYLYFFILIFCFANLNLFSQLSEIDIEQIYESSEDFEYSEEQIDYIEWAKKNKINLLYASIEDLTRFPTFDINTSFRILEYVNNNPKTTVENLSKELSLIGEQIIILESCTYIEEIPAIEKLSLLFRTRYKTTDNPVYGFENARFVGDKMDLSNRLKININNFGTNVVIDKDAGERSLIDYNSLNIWYDNKKNIQIIVGDFEYQLGMGNVLWKTFGDRKGINNIAPALKFKQSGKPFFSTVDYSRLRGISADYLIKISDISIKCGGFYSIIKKSATYDSTKDIISSIYTSGLYRTHTEISKIDKVIENSYSGNMSLNYKDLLIGTGFFKLNYSKEIQTSSYKFPNSNQNLYKTFFANYNNENFSIATELSLDEFNYLGFSLGSIFNIEKSKIALHIRSFDKDFRSPYGSIFGEFSYPSNEYGLYIGFLTSIFKNVRTTSFIDLFKSYGPTYSIDDIVYGFTLFNQFDYTIKTKLKGTSRIVIENKTNSKTISSIKSIFQETDYLLRQEFIYNLNKVFNIRIRNEIAIIDNSGVLPDELGYASFLDINYEFEHFKLGARFSLFNTDSYISAIWQYEYYIQGYMYSFPAYLEGSRYSLYSKIDLMKYKSINVVYNYTQKNNLAVLGSGDDRILRNYSNVLFIQLNLNY